MNQRMAATAAKVSERVSIASFIRGFQLARRRVHQAVISKAATAATLTTKVAIPTVSTTKARLELGDMRSDGSIDLDHAVPAPLKPTLPAPHQRLQKASYNGLSSISEVGRSRRAPVRSAALLSRPRGEAHCCLAWDRSDFNLSRSELTRTKPLGRHAGPPFERMGQRADLAIAKQPCDFGNRQCLVMQIAPAERGSQLVQYLCE